MQSSIMAWILIILSLPEPIRSLHLAMRLCKPAIFARKTPAYAALDPVQQSGDGYRGATVRTPVRAVETAPERSERRRLLAANMIEVAARVAHALLVCSIGALVVTRLQTF